MKKLLVVSMIFAAAQAAHAADVEAGRQLASAVCAACHGATGISVSDMVPNLAGQRARYTEAQLKSFKDGTRKGPDLVSRAAIMNAIAAFLSAEDIANVAAYFESQSGGVPGTKSELLPNISTTKVTFPDNSKQSFTKYYTLNFPGRKEVRYFYANTAALAAAKAGKPLPDGSILFAEVYSAKLDPSNNPITDADGFYVPEKMIRYVAMQREANWGNNIPELLRNENWNYAGFAAAKQYQQGVNQAECLACHKPLSRTSYIFTLKQLAGAK
jgi:cytochrome c553